MALTSLDLARSSAGASALLDTTRAIRGAVWGSSRRAWRLEPVPETSTAMRTSTGGHPIGGAGECQPDDRDGPGRGTNRPHGGRSAGSTLHPWPKPNPRDSLRRAIDNPPRERPILRRWA